MTSLRLENVSASLTNTFSLQRVNAHFKPGELTGIVGPNGAGKSTLAKLILGVAPLSDGRILVNETDLTRLSRRQRAKYLGYLPQAASFSWRMPVSEAVRLGRYYDDSPIDSDAFDKLIDDCRLTDLLNRDVFELSGGEQMRVHLARLMYGRHAIIVADEPCASLDIAHQHRIMALLRQHSRSHVAIVIIHDFELAQRYCDRLLLLQGGRLALDADPQTVLSSPSCAATFGVDFNRYVASSSQNDVQQLLIAHPAHTDET